jgi:hypothetical protein
LQTAVSDAQTPLTSAACTTVAEQSNRAPSQGIVLEDGTWTS